MKLTEMKLTEMKCDHSDLSYGRRTKWKTTKMEDNQNGRRPKWKTTKMEDDQNGRQPKWKTTKMEDDQNGRRPKWKMTKMEDDQNGRRPKFEDDQNGRRPKWKTTKMEASKIEKTYFLKKYFTESKKLRKQTPPKTTQKNDLYDRAKSFGPFSKELWPFFQNFQIIARTFAEKNP